MNSTAEIPETAHAFDPSNFTVVPARVFEDLCDGEVFSAPSLTLTDAHATAFQRGELVLSGEHRYLLRRRA